MFLKKIITSVLALSFVLLVNAQDDVKKWRFINIPDYHKSEGLSTPVDDERDKRLKEGQIGFDEMYQKYGGELITIPGDIVSGHWYRKKYLTKFKSNPKFENYSTTEVVLESCKRSYEGLWQMMHKAGYGTTLVAVGDHEIGDNPWQKGSEVVKHIATFREGFANVFTKDKNGNSRFAQKIGDAPARPIGTIYEHTSNAYQHKNILFITLDMFRFDSKDIVLGNQGVVSGDISGKHFEWLEHVLKEAQTIASIDHIIVQSHLPIIYPVRKFASSGMLVDDNQSEKILNLFRAYNVDVYLAGEVHMNTVTKDPKSDLIQFVGRGNDLGNLTTVDVEKDKLTLNTYHKNGLELGSLVVDKSKLQTSIDATGLLTPINPKGLQIHWSFDEVLDESNYINSVEGTFPKIAKQNSLLKNMKSPKAFLNDGDFNYDYSLISENTPITKGIIGNAIEISAESKLFVLPIGPMDAGYERTLSCWVKTTASGRQLIFNSGSFWGESGQFFNLSLNEGDLELSLRPEAYTRTKKMNINDGNWHHLVIVSPKKNGLLEDVQLFIDGQEIFGKLSESETVKIKTSQANWMSIATTIPSYKTNMAETMQMVNYEGLLDEFCIWTRALTSDEIKQLYNQSFNGVNALDLEKKFSK